MFPERSFGDSVIYSVFFYLYLERSDFPPNYKNYGNDNRYYNDLFDHPDDNDEIEMEDIDEDISMRDPRPWIRLRRILNTGHRWYQKAKSKVPKLIRRTRKWYRIGKQHFPHFMSTARSRYPDFMNLVEKVLENKSNRKIDFKEGPHIE